MIPINLAIIGAGSQASSRRRGFSLGLAYGGAMALVYGVLGVVVILTAGTFGTINASPWFNAAIAALFVVLALAMFDVIPISEGWTASLAEGLARARRDRVPVLIDFWATWCKNCLTMDTTTLAHPEVTSALSRYVKIKVQAEDPDAAATRALMARFNAIGLPTYVILYPAEWD